MTRPAARAVAAALVLSIGVLWPTRHPVLAAASTCAINSTTPINFGVYDPFALTQTDSVGNVSYTCSNNLTLVVSLSGVDATGARKFASGTDSLIYNIFADAARSIPIGDGTNGVPPLTIVNSGSNQKTLQLYGRISAGQDVGAGTYSTSLVLTFNF